MGEKSNIYQGPISAAVLEPGPIRRVVDDLDHQLITLMEQVQNLSDQLSYIKGSPAPEPSKTAANVPPSGSDLYVALAQFSIRVQNIRDEVTDCLKRLQI